MLVQRHFAIDSMGEVRRLITSHGWALLVTGGTRGLQAAHVPCLLDPEQDPGGDANELVVIGHAVRKDPAVADLTGDDEILLVFQGPHGYISPAWYESGPYVPTWNFTAAHLHGVPELLDGEGGLAVLERTVEHFESARDDPWRLDTVRDYAQRIAAATLPFRLRTQWVEAKAKLSQDKPREVQERVVAALAEPGPYQQLRLADEMRRVLAIPPLERV
jgi:transcriptional regulator